MPDRNDDPKDLAFDKIFATITQNYRFIPFDREPARAVLRPPDEATSEADERRELSHSVPLEGGYSGRITMCWVARSPVLFGTQRTVVTREGNNYRITEPQVLHAGTDAPYVIPGRALRGMLRRVLRIATRGKAGPFDDAQPFRREPRYQSRRIPGPGSDLRPPEPAWLVFDADDGWKLLPCRAVPVGCNHAAIADIVTSKKLRERHAALTAEITGKIQKEFGGYLVLSGQMHGKTHEQVFMPPQDEAGMPVSPEAFMKFRKAYGSIDARGEKSRLVPSSNLEAWLGHFLHLPQDEVDDGWAAQLGREFDVSPKECATCRRPDRPPGIPVYFYPAEDGRDMVMGMTQIMRLPTAGTVETVVRRAQPAVSWHDWSETMFGYVEGQDALRGRIDFGFASAPSAGIECLPAKNQFYCIVQASPRPGHFATYLRRAPASNKKPSKWPPATYDSDGALAAGRKVYPVWNAYEHGWRPRTVTIEVDRALTPEEEAETKITDVSSYLRALPPHTVFEGRIDVHNLTLPELGALLWTISLGDPAAFEPFDAAAYRRDTAAASVGGDAGPLNSELARYCHVGGRARGYDFGALIPAGVTLSRLKRFDRATGMADAEQGLWRHAIAAYARQVHGIEGDDPNAVLAALHELPRLRRLRHLLDRFRPDDDDLLGQRFPNKDERDPDKDEEPFDDYRYLRQAMDDRPGGRSRRDAAANLDAAKAGTSDPDLLGNILDLGSDPLRRGK